MKQRRNLDREGLEVYLLNLLLAYRPLFLVMGLFLFLYAIIILAYSLVVGGIAMVVTLALVLMGYSYPATLFIAKVGAWLGSVRKKDRGL
jgi:hypothetical protein